MKAVVAVSDLLFQSRIEAALRQRGVTFDAPAGQAASEEALKRSRLLIVDLQGEGLEPAALIRAASDAGARVLAFGRHTDAAALRAAREAGAQVVVSRSQLADSLPAILDGLVASVPGSGAGADGAAGTRD